MTTPPTALLSRLQQTLENGKPPGLYYAFFDAQQIQFEFSGGNGCLEPLRPVDPEMAFYAYSMTKPFSATAVLQLAEQGNLRLEDPVIHYLPGFKYSDQITIRHLLSHSAGLPNPLPMRWIHLVEEHPTFDEKAFFENIFGQISKVRSQPNERFAYSNLGYILLSQVIARVSGMPYKAYVETHLIKRLQLSDQLGFALKSHWNTAIGYQKAFSFGNFIIGFLLDRSKYMKKKRPAGSTLSLST